VACAAGITINRDHTASFSTWVRQAAPSRRLTSGPGDLPVYRLRRVSRYYPRGSAGLWWGFTTIATVPRGSGTRLRSVAEREERRQSRIQDITDVMCKLESIRAPRPAAIWVTAATSGSVSRLP